VIDLKSISLYPHAYLLAVQVEEPAREVLVPVVALVKIESDISDRSVADARLRWYALQVDGKLLTQVAGHLRYKGFETFIPVCKAMQYRSDKKRSIESPLFPGYVFARLEIENRLPVLVTPGVYGIVRYGRQPAPICDTEIASLKEIVKSGVHCEPWAYLNKGDKVTITHGPLAGLTGILVEVKKSLRVVISIDLIQRAVAAEVDLDAIQPVAAATRVS
jgi:transcription antitermination factor NusG